MDRSRHPPLRSVSSAAALSSSSSPYRWCPVPTTPTSRPQTPASSATRAVAASPISRSGAGQEVETLYNHPDIKIVAFTCGGQDNAPGTLPWTSPHERSIAVGGFTIYRAPGSVAFINCGSALQPILKKSRCWCVDEASARFVLQIRRPSYWRIELPAPAQGHEGDSERARFRGLRDVFDRILLFEKTPCPFTRPFTVELPDMPAVKLVPWAPRPVTAQPASRRPSPVSRWARRRLTESAADFAGHERTSSIRSVDSSPELELTSQDDKSVSGSGVKERCSEARQAQDDNGARPAAAAESAGLGPGVQETVSSSPPRSNSSSLPGNATIAEQDTSSSPIMNYSPTTYYSSYTSSSQPTTPGYEPLADDLVSLPKPRLDVCAGCGPDGLGIHHAKSSSSAGQDDENTAETWSNASSSPERPRMRHRNSISLGAGNGVLRPLPPPATNLFSPSRPDQPPPKFRALGAVRSIEQLRRLPMAIISKAVGVVLHPPRTLFGLMLRVAAKISAGEWIGVAYGVGEDGEHIPVQWDYSDMAANINTQPNDEEMPSRRVFEKRRSRSFAGGEAQTDSRGWDVD